MTTDPHECDTCHTDYVSARAADICCTDDDYDRGYD